MNTSGICLNKSEFVKSKTGLITDEYLIGKVTMGFMQELGKGAYGTVYAAKLKGSDKKRAIKQIKKSSIRNPAIFYNEISILKKLDHPKIIKVY